MFYRADLHVHSHYSQATSKFLNLETLYQWAQIKGIDVVGTGDFTHPAWFRELQEKLVPDGDGFFRLKNPPRETALPSMKVKATDTRFCLSAEICCMYESDGRQRQIHHLVYAPDLDTAQRINERLGALGDLAADGRPMLRISSHDLLEILLNISERAYLVPAHIWTPWYSTLGARSGYDSIESCFRDLTPYIFAVETSLSATPGMIRRCSKLDRFRLMSNSDAHSAHKLGREVNLFDTAPGYDGLFNAVKTGDGFTGTYEFFPQAGKYYHDGHRDCKLSFDPHGTAQYKGVCPNCGKPLTIGVLHRVQDFTDRPAPEGANAFQFVMPLAQVLAEVHGWAIDGKRTEQALAEAISFFGNEFTVLTEMDIRDISVYDHVLAEAIHRVRRQQVNHVPGYDGVYGKAAIFKEGEVKRLKKKQLSMF